MIYSMNAQSKNVFAKSKIYNIGKEKLFKHLKPLVISNKQTESSLSKF